MKRTGYIFLALAIICTCVIWSFSLKNAMVSTEESTAVTEVIQDILESVFDTEIKVSDVFVRKAAHFSEFFVLGALVYAAFYFLISRSLTKILYITSSWTLLTAVTDELLQLLSDGRSTQLTDVLIDFSGSVSAMILLSVILYKKIKKAG